MRVLVIIKVQNMKKVLLVISVLYCQISYCQNNDCKTGVNLSLSKMNILYEKVPNNFDYSTINLDRDSFTLGCTQGVLESIGNSNIIKDLEVGTVKIFLKKGDRNYTSFYYRVKEIPEPQFKINQEGSSLISMKSLESLNFVGGQMVDFDWNVRPKIVSFTAITYVNGKLQNTYSHEGSKFSKDFKASLSKLEDGDSFLLKDIKYELILNAEQINSKVLKTKIKNSLLFLVVE